MELGRVKSTQLALAVDDRVVAAVLRTSGPPAVIRRHEMASAHRAMDHDHLGKDRDHREVVNGRLGKGRHLPRRIREHHGVDGVPLGIRRPRQA
jgi:hypothetical protein